MSEYDAVLTVRTPRPWWRPPAIRWRWLWVTIAHGHRVSRCHAGRPEWWAIVLTSKTRPPWSCGCDCRRCTREHRDQPYYLVTAVARKEG